MPITERLPDVATSRRYGSGTTASYGVSWVERAINTCSAVYPPASLLIWNDSFSFSPYCVEAPVKTFWTDVNPVWTDAPRRPVAFPHWLTNQALKEITVVRGELTKKAEYFAGIDKSQVEKVAALVAIVLLLELRPESLTTSLTYDQTLHMRASLPNGAGSAHVSVIFTPGIDPGNTAALGEDADNTLVARYDHSGNYLNGTTGPLFDALAQLSALAHPSAAAITAGQSA